jgi:Mn-dependent DtxR family transcriptional regulator
MQQYFGVTPAAVRQMVLKLEIRGFIERVPRRPRTFLALVPPEKLPDLA